MFGSGMKLNSGQHLAYCTNIHRGESWAETFAALQTHTLAVRDRVSPQAAYGIGLRLSERAAHELSDRATLLAFQRWLGQQHSTFSRSTDFPTASSTARG